MMNNLVITMVALDSCRFYAENMVAIQFGSSLHPVPPEPPFNQPINSRVLHSQIAVIEKSFDNAISRTDLEFPIQGILYRFRSIFGRYVNQYMDDPCGPSGKRVNAERPDLFIAQPVPVRGEDESVQDFSHRFISYTADQVRGFIWMVSLDQYAREQTDCFLPDAPWEFKLPARDTASAFIGAHHEIVNALMMAMLNTYSDTLDIHPSLRAYGTDVVFPLVAECRNVIYAAWTVNNKVQSVPQFAPIGKYTTFEDLPVDDDEEEFEPIPEMGPMFENQSKWEDIAKSVAAGLGLIAMTDDSDSGFELIPRIYASADDFMYHNVGPITEKYVFDIAFTPADVHPDLRHIQALHAAAERIQKHALDFSCHTITRLVGYSGELKTVLIRVQRNVDFPDQDFVIENLLGALYV